jgi:hypothetical protein
VHEAFVAFALEAKAEPVKMAFRDTEAFGSVLTSQFPLV